MPLLSPKLLVPVAVVVVAWGGAHLLAGRDSVSLQPAVWPGAAATATAAPTPASTVPSATAFTPSASPAAGSVPILPGALQQLNGSTRDTAIGMYDLITQLESSLRSHVEQLVQQLEPGR